ncbi:MAG: RluA family pseudouridine synthase [Spirochaetota bacterium]
MRKITQDDILYEDNHIIAVFKHPGELSQDDSTGQDPLQEKIKAFIKEKDHKPGNVYLGTLHRLDKPVSGAVLFAKTSKAAARMSEIIRDKKALKIYVALTCGGSFGKKGEPEILSDALERKGDMTFTVPGKKADASLEILTVASHGGYSLHAIRLISGKKHQIRAQLASRGFPVCGDRRYGSREYMPEDAIALHCLCMGFIHPVKNEKIIVTAPIPVYIKAKIPGIIETEKIIALYDRKWLPNEQTSRTEVR